MTGTNTSRMHALHSGTLCPLLNGVYPISTPLWERYERATVTSERTTHGTDGRQPNSGGICEAKLFTAWEQAAQNDGEAKARSKKYFDRSATSILGTKYWSCLLLFQVQCSQSRRRSLMLHIGLPPRTGGRKCCA
jgi:hypothetical protein